MDGWTDGLDNFPAIFLLNITAEADFKDKSENLISGPDHDDENKNVNEFHFHGDEESKR